jgi:hypothetical protein
MDEAPVIATKPAELLSALLAVLNSIGTKSVIDVMIVLVLVSALGLALVISRWW